MPIMNFPKIPTDNLYKFLSIIGIIILLISMIPKYLEFKFNGDFIKIECESEILDRKMEFFKSDVDLKKEELGNDIFKMRDDYKEKNKTENVDNFNVFKDSLVNYIMGFQNEFDGLTAKNQELTFLIIAHKYKLKEQLYYKGLIRYSKVLSFILIVFGVPLSSFGFFLWYKKLQVPIDKLLRNQANRRNTFAVKKYFKSINR